MVKLCLKRKNGLLAVISLLLICISSHAQVTNHSMGNSPWKYANPRQYGFVLQDLSFVDNNTGLGVGANGAIARSTDGGYNWDYIFYKYVTNTNSVALASFNEVQLVTQNVAYAVGAGGLMIKSTDGGITWTKITTPLTANGRSINTLYFLNKDTGYIGGAALNTTNTTSINDAPKVYFTRNGGTTWDSLATPFRPQQWNTANPPPATILSAYNQSEIYRIVFLNDSVGYVAGNCANALATNTSILWKIEKGVVKDYGIHKSKFGFSTFSGGHVPSTSQWRGLMPVNDSVVLISANTNGVIIRVQTGKNDSTASAIPQIYGAYERGVYTITAWVNSGIPAGTPLSGSAMWHMKKTPDGRIAMSNGNRIAFSVDHGSNWTVSYPGVPHAWWSLQAMDITPNGRIITGGASGIMFDSLPGSPWRTQRVNARVLGPNGVPLEFSSMDFADYCNGVAVGTNGTIVKTSDGGKTWVNNSDPIWEASQVGLGNLNYPAVDKMFFTAGMTIYRSADQGTTSQALFTEPSGNAAINSMTSVTPDVLFAVSQRFSPAVQRTFIYRTTNASSGSVTWSTYSDFPTGNLAPTLRNIKFANVDTGYTCGTRGKVYRTTDGGNTWNDISPDTLVNGNGSATYAGLSVVNGRTLYVSGTGRRLFKSTDAGVTWTDMTIAVPPAPTPFTTNTNFDNIIMNDANNGYMSAGILLLKTTDGWATWTYDMSPLTLATLKLYPKIPLPLESKKLYATVLQGSTFVNSQITATILEYGNAAVYNMSTTETKTDASCSNPTAGSITVTATGGLTPYTYSINGGPYQSSNVFTGLTSGAKTVSIKDGGCQTITKTITIDFIDNLTLTANNDTLVCAGAAVQMNASANLASTTFSWSPSTGLSATNIANPIATATANTAYVVTASLNGCVKTETVNVGMKPNPLVNAGPDKTIMEGGEALLQGSGSGTSTTSIAWTPTNSILYGGTTYQVKVKPATTTTYTLTVKDANGCTSTDDAIVTVVPNCADVKNAFTPNGDGLNDRWVASSNTACYTKLSVAVYNRYGGEVYKNDNYNNDWDGTYKGKPIADGTYYYIVNYKLIDGRTVTLKGDVTILR
jgi:gliding motility-associated-like protein